MSDWVRTADRLPERNQQVLMFRRGWSRVTTGYFDSMGGWYMDRRDKRLYQIPTHWMPTPPRPDERVEGGSYEAWASEEAAREFDGQ